MATDEKWKLTKLVDIPNMPRAALRAFKKVTPEPLVTMDDLQKFQAKHGDFWAKDLPGVGPGTRQNVEDALEAFWTRQAQGDAPDDAPSGDAETPDEPAEAVDDEPETEEGTTKTAGEQLDLLDVTPEYVKPIKAAARRYKKWQKERMSALANEIKARDEIKAALHEIIQKDKTLKPDDDGTFRFSLGDMTVSLKPRDELVKVKFEDDEDGAGED